MTEVETSVGLDMPNEQKRVREIVAMYRDPLLGGAGEPAARLMERDLQEAEQAMASGDVVRIVRAYAELKTWKGER